MTKDVLRLRDQLTLTIVNMQEYLKKGQAELDYLARAKKVFNDSQ